jgi:hypothetical protein
LRSKQISTSTTDQGGRQNRFESHRTLTVIIVTLLFGFLLDVVGASLFKQLAGYAWSQRALERQKHVERTYRIPSPIYHHDLAANIAVDNATYGIRTYRVRTNALGFKDRAIRNVPLTSDRRRLLFMGDSMTEGIGIEYPYTFVGRVDETLSRQGIEVLNAAVASYCPTIYWTKLKYLLEDRGLKIDEVVVFLDLTDAWDDLTYQIDEHGAVAERGLQTDDAKAIIGAVVSNRRPMVDNVRDFVRDRTILTAAMSRLIWTRSRFRQPEFFDLKGQWTYNPDVFESIGRKGLIRMKEHMDKLRLLLQAHDVTLRLGVYPWPDQITHNDLDSIQVRFWKQWCDENQIPFLNLFPTFVKPRSDAEMQKFLKEYFLPDDVHWNERGHALVADRFLDFYKKTAGAGTPNRSSSNTFGR